MPEDVPTPPPRGLKERLYDVILNLVPEIFAAFLLLVAVGALEKLVHWWIGDYKFFDLLPVRYVFDAGDFAIILFFLVRTIMKIGRD